MDIYKGTLYTTSGIVNYTVFWRVIYQFIVKVLLVLKFLSTSMFTLIQNYFITSFSFEASYQSRLEQLWNQWQLVSCPIQDSK